MAWFGARTAGATAAAFRALSAVDGRLDSIGAVGPRTRARSSRLASRPPAAAGSSTVSTSTSIATVACASCASRSTVERSRQLGLMPAAGGRVSARWRWRSAPLPACSRQSGSDVVVEGGAEPNAARSWRETGQRFTGVKGNLPLSPEDGIGLVVEVVGSSPRTSGGDVVDIGGIWLYMSDPGKHNDEWSWCHAGGLWERIPSVRGPCAMVVGVRRW